VAVFLEQPLEAARRLDGVEVLALEVLDQGRLEGLGVAELAHEDGHLVEARALRCAPPALARDDLVAAGAALADEDGLEDADLADALRELVEGRLVEVRSRLPAVRVQLFDRCGEAQRGRGRGARLARDEGVEAAAEARLLGGRGHERGVSGRGIKRLPSPRGARARG
jgi:hypothetical protein